MDIVIIDFEATCYSHDIIEVGMVRYNLETQMPTAVYETLVCPNKMSKVDKRCQDVTGLTRDDLAGAPKFKDVVKVMDEFYRASGRFTLLGTWSQHDRELLVDNCQRREVSIPHDGIYIDIQREYGKFSGMLPKRPALTRTITELGIECVGRAHRALNDACNTALVLDHMLKHGWNLSQNIFPVRVKKIERRFARRPDEEIRRSIKSRLA